MANLITDKYISFPKEELKEYLDLEYSVGVTPFALNINSVDYTAKTFTVTESIALSDGQVTVQTFELSFQELIDNFLLTHDPNIVVANIKSIGQNSVVSSITVGY
jgi:hypothetical protein